MAAEDEDVVALKEQVALKDTTVKKKNGVTDEKSQWREKSIIVGREEIKDNEKKNRGRKTKRKRRKRKS